MNKEGVVSTYDGILVIKKDEILTFVTTWMNLEHIMLSEISQILYDFTYMWNINNKADEQTSKQKQRYRYREQSDGCKMEVGGGGKI